MAELATHYMDPDVEETRRVLVRLAIDGIMGWGEVQVILAAFIASRGLTDADA